MDEMFDTRPLRLSGYLPRRFDVHGLKCLVPVLNIKTDRIHHCVSASNSVAD
jgi:hypothetical protein